jgi:phenylacetic acid degradation operon negative regulatory protein
MTSQRTRNLVFTLYGDYLLERGPIRVGSLLTLLGKLRVSPAAARTVLCRMTQRGWLTADRRRAKSFYGLTERGHRLLETGRERIYHPPRDQAWDGSWYLIAYSIPEADRHRRDQLRVKLAWLGCGQLGHGVWITPHDVRHEVREIAEALKVTKRVEVFKAGHHGLSTTEQLVRQCWDLTAINRSYAAFLARWSPALNHCAQCRMAASRAEAEAFSYPCTLPDDCFVKRFQLVHEYRAFPLEDPYLPAPLLPADWQGAAAAKLFDTYHRVLAEPAEEYVAEVCAATDAADDDALRQRGMPHGPVSVPLT